MGALEEHPAYKDGRVSWMLRKFFEMLFNHNIERKQLGESTKVNTIL